MFARTDENRPVPSAIDGRKWTVAPSPAMSGATNVRQALLFAPMADDPTARLIRNHELIHARITPHIDPSAAVAKYGASMGALQWSEDFRVSCAMARRRLAPEDAISESDADTVARSMVASGARGVAAALLANWAQRSARRRLGEAFERAGVPGDAVREIVTMLDGMIGGVTAGVQFKRSRGKAGGLQHWETASGFAKITAPLARLFDSIFPEGGASADGNATRPGGVVVSVPGLSKWAPVIDIVTNLDRPNAIRPRNPRRRRFSDCGVVPRAMHRYPIDGTVFTHKRRQKGGTILVDASGSMAWGDDDMERIIKDAPAAMIAFYSGRKRPDIGKIVIGAKDGRAAPAAAIRRALPGLENMIDGPALRWLARQPAPRVWVSDEEVGGVSDFGKGGAGHRECLAICAAAGIRIVKSIDRL